MNPWCSLVLSSSFLEAVLLPLVEQIRLCRAQIDNLRTAVAVLLQNGALLAVVGVTDTGPAANDTPALVAAVVALVADSHQRRRSHQRVADDALAVAFLAEAADGDARLLPAEDQIRVVLGH